MWISRRLMCYGAPLSVRFGEACLGTRLPSSYRAFVKVTNGWHLADEVTDRLLPVEEIEWFAARYPDWVAAWDASSAAYASPDMSPISDDEYLVYGEVQDEIR